MPDVYKRQILHRSFEMLFQPAEAPGKGGFSRTIMSDDGCGAARWERGFRYMQGFRLMLIGEGYIPVSYTHLGLIGPIIAAFTFTDDLAVLWTNVEEISQLLNAEELNHKETPIKLEDTGISLRSVSFSYDGTTEVLHGVSLTIRPGTMTALVGPSGSGKSTVDVYKRQM